MTIRNRCSNIELAAPVYFIKNATHHIQFPQQVNSKSKMQTNFRTSIDQDTFGGALMYRIQRKMDTSTSTQLLAIWGYNTFGFYLHALLIEHKNTLAWNEDKLKKLYDVYNSQLHASPLTVRSWLLDDDTKLQTSSGSSHGGFRMEVTISEDKYMRSPRKPLWIDSNR
jgi:hypothetical protein